MSSEILATAQQTVNKCRNIRRTKPDDLSAVMHMIECGRQKMRATGNMKQWTDGNPSEEQILNDIADGHSYIVEDNGIPVATFAFIAGPDVTYANIYEGEWLDEVRPYYVIHRIASVHTARGVLADVLAYCFSVTDNIRIDTHRDNLIMRTALKKYGFGYCGIIYLLDGAERLAYQRIITQ